jgi:spermidine synthase
MLALFAVGLFSIVIQVVFLRELSVAFYGVELMYTLAIAMWLLWTGLGAGIWRRIGEPSGAQLALLFAGSSIAVPLGIAMIRSIRPVLAPAPGVYLSFPIQMLALAAALLPVGLLSGLQFQWAAKRLIARGQSLPFAYAVESAGGLAGGLGATALFAAGAANFAVALGCALLSAGAACILGNRNRELRSALLVVAAALAGALWRAPALDRAMTMWNHPDLIDSRDSAYGRITVTRSAGQTSLYENDALSFDTEATGAEELAHVAALQNPEPKNVLIMGGGAEGLVGEILRHRPTHVDYVELNPALLEVARTDLPNARASLADPAVRIHVADPRAYLAGLGVYDLILVGMPEPASGQANRFYTVEFFRECASRMRDGAVLGFRLRSSENLWTPQLARRNASIYAALKAVFRSVQVLPGATNILLGSNRDLVRCPEVLASRFDRRGLTARLVSGRYLKYLYTNDRFRQIREVLERENASPNTDARPVCYVYTVMLWLAKFAPELAFADPISSEQLKIWAVAALAAIALLFLWARRSPAFRGSLFAATAGFLGMILETLVVLQYQVKSGMLFRDIGLLLMGFMAGLAAGALAAHHWALRGRRVTRRPGAGLLVGFAGISACLSASPGIGNSLWLSGLVMLLTGALVSAAFAYASVRYYAHNQPGATAALYSADLVGGCAGAIIGTLVLVPIGGVAAAAALIPIAAAAGLLL